jgi:hypothetical protein
LADLNSESELKKSEEGMLALAEGKALAKTVALKRLFYWY